jgi:hypothetical protein
MGEQHSRSEAGFPLRGPAAVLYGGISEGRSCTRLRSLGTPSGPSDRHARSWCDRNAPQVLDQGVDQGHRHDHGRAEQRPGLVGQAPARVRRAPHP